MARQKAAPPAQREAVRTGPQADPTTILARLTPEERGWFIDLIARLSAVEVVLDEAGRPTWRADVEPNAGELARQVRMVRTFLDQVLFGHPRPGCAHRENPIPKPTRKKGGPK